MPTFINGLPLHPLVIHAVVVLVPLTVLGAIVIAGWPAARRRYGSLVVAVGAAAFVADIIAEQAGEGLEHALPRDPAIEAHAALGGGLKLWVGALLVVTGALVLLHRRRTVAGERVGRARQEGPGTVAAPVVTGPNRIVAVVLAVLVVAVALGTAYQVYRVGDSGAQAVWGGRVYSSG